MPTGHTEIIDHDQRLLKAITRRINRSSAIVCEKKKRGSILKFAQSGKEHPISLRYFVYAKYKGLELWQVRGKKIRIHDDSSIADNILDIRSCNLYDAGGLRPHTDNRDIQIVKRPDSGERYIAITFPNRKNGKTEYADYSPELYEMLASLTYCNVRYNPHNDRATVVVHYGGNKDSYIRDNLAKFLLIFYHHFEKFKNMTGSVKRFIHSYRRLSDQYGNVDAAHINAVKWNNCRGNLAFMVHETNDRMRNFIKFFTGSHGVFTTVNEQDEILIEFTNGGSDPRYFRCKTPEDYLDWQKIFLGKALTHKLQRKREIAGSEIREKLTPCGMIKTGKISKDVIKENEPNLWIWLDHRDRMLSMDYSDFFPYQRNEARTIPGIVPTLMAYVYGMMGSMGKENGKS